MLSPTLAWEDVDAAALYYVEKLGFERTFAMQGNDGKTTFAGVKLGDAEILLGVTEGFVAPEDVSRRGIGIQLHVDGPSSMNIGAVYEKAKAAGATITREIETREWGERSFNVRDADGHNLMLVQVST